MFDIYELRYVLRLIVAGLCGILIGLERKNRSKEAGIRTHFVVACGAALMMVVSKYAFFDVIGKGMYEGIEVRLDPSRIASTIASGIGFLGAGMIFVQKNTIKGLTTAAGIWATSGVGMAIGAGMYVLGITSTVVVLLAQILLHLNLKKNKQPKTKLLIIKDVKTPNYQEYITALFDELGIVVHDVTIDKNFDEGTCKYIFAVEIPYKVREDKLISKIDNNVSLRTSM